MKFTILNSNDRIATVFRHAREIYDQLPHGDLRQHWDNVVKTLTNKMNDTFQDQIEMLTFQLKDQEEKYVALQALHTNLNFRYEELKSRLESVNIHSMKLASLEAQVGQRDKEIYDLKAELKVQCQNRDHFRSLVTSQDAFIEGLKKQVEAYKKSKQEEHEQAMILAKSALQTKTGEAEHLAKQAIRLTDENEKYREQTTRLIEEKRVLTDKLNGLECRGCQTGEHGAYCGGCLGCLLRQAEYALELSNNELNQVKYDLETHKTISYHQSLAMGVLYPIVHNLTNRWFQPKGVTAALETYHSACEKIAKEMKSLSTTPKATPKAVPPPDLKSMPETCCGPTCSSCGDVNNVI